jgi:P4 family phage/plasmid primase-like protien
MQDAQRWICWRPVPDRENPQKILKIPIDPFTNRPFEKGSGWQTDPSRWASFDQLNGQPKGFTLGDDWAGIDLDDCIVGGKVEPWAIELVRALKTYAEISPSGTGIKIFMRSTAAERAPKVKKCAAWQWEVYGEKHYFTVTGNKLPDAPSEIYDRTEALQKLIDLVWGEDLVWLCRLRGLILRESGANVHIRCPWQAEHTRGHGETDTALHIKDGAVVGFHCFHGHCAARTLRDIRKWFDITGGLVRPLTEYGDAESLADGYGDVLRYDHRQGRWLVSDETSGIWIPDPVEQLTQLCAEMMRTRQREALTITNTVKKTAAIKWAIRGESKARLTNALALARSVPPIADEGDHWDEDPFLLGVQNGVIDLRTGRWRKATPADRVTMRVRTSYDPSATCPKWMKTLDDIFAPQDLFTADASAATADARHSMIGFLQRALGYSITGDCREECCFFTWGDGCNGKGTVMNTVAWLFGDYTDDMPYSTLERSERGSGIPNDIAKLVGKRFITCAEVNEFKLNEARLKALTGRDPMTARFLNHEFFTFIPVCKIWIATNHKPKIVGQDDGIWRRIHLIPFTQTFEGRENKQLKDELRGELPGILNWILTGAALWLRDGLNPPDTVTAATKAYRQESNPITPFVEACCVVGKDLQGKDLCVQAKLAFDAYEKFCGGQRRLSDKSFYKAMAQRFEKQELRGKSRQRQMFYMGVGLRASGVVDPEPPGGTEAADDQHFADQDEDGL